MRAKGLCRLARAHVCHCLSRCWCRFRWTRARGEYGRRQGAGSIALTGWRRCGCYVRRHRWGSCSAAGICISPFCGASGFRCLRRHQLCQSRLVGPPVRRERLCWWRSGVAARPMRRRRDLCGRFRTCLPLDGHVDHERDQAEDSKRDPNLPWDHGDDQQNPDYQPQSCPRLLPCHLSPLSRRSLPQAWGSGDRKEDTSTAKGIQMACGSEDCQRAEAAAKAFAMVLLWAKLIGRFQ